MKAHSEENLRSQLERFEKERQERRENPLGPRIELASSIAELKSLDPLMGWLVHPATLRFIPIDRELPYAHYARLIPELSQVQASLILAGRGLQAKGWTTLARIDEFILRFGLEPVTAGAPRRKIQVPHLINLFTLHQLRPFTSTYDELSTILSTDYRTTRRLIKNRCRTAGGWCRSELQEELASKRFWRDPAVAARFGLTPSHIAYACQFTTEDDEFFEAYDRALEEMEAWLIEDPTRFFYPPLPKLPDHLPSDLIVPAAGSHRIEVLGDNE